MSSSIFFTLSLYFVPPHPLSLLHRGPNLLRISNQRLSYPHSSVYFVGTSLAREGASMPPLPANVLTFLFHFLTLSKIKPGLDHVGGLLSTNKLSYQQLVTQIRASHSKSNFILEKSFSSYLTSHICHSSKSELVYS